MCIRDSMKVVIFSGYDDFEYAQKAIKLHVTEYVLKPVNVAELTSILKRIKSSLDEEIEEKRNVNRLRENYRRSLPTVSYTHLDVYKRQASGSGRAVPENTGRTILCQRALEAAVPGSWREKAADILINCRYTGLDLCQIPLHLKAFRPRCR